MASRNSAGEQKAEVAGTDYYLKTLVNFYIKLRKNFEKI